MTTLNALAPTLQVKSQVEVLAPTVNTAFTLPSAANTVGKLYTIYNNGTANVLVQASDASLIVTVQPATAAVVTPLQDAPTTSTQWICLSNGVNATGVKGNTTGAAVAAGYPGEVIKAATPRSSGITQTSGGIKDNGNITLQKGVYLVGATTGFNMANATTISYAQCYVSLTANNGALSSAYAWDLLGIENITVLSGTFNAYSGGSDLDLQVGPYPVIVSSPTTLYGGGAVYFSGTVQQYGSIWAVRIV